LFLYAFFIDIHKVMRLYNKKNETSSPVDRAQCFFCLRITNNINNERKITDNKLIKINANAKKKKSSKSSRLFESKEKVKIYYISTVPLQQNQKTKTIKIPARSFLVFFFLINNHHHLDQSKNH